MSCQNRDWLSQPGCQNRAVRTGLSEHSSHCSSNNKQDRQGGRAGENRKVCGNTGAVQVLAIYRTNVSNYRINTAVYRTYVTVYRTILLFTELKLLFTELILLFT